MMWIVAMALAAWDPQVEHKNEVSCDLAPYMGGGSSTEGRLDSMSGLGLGCAVVLWGKEDWTVGPKLEISEQRWTVFQSEGEVTRFDTYQARTLNLGLQTNYTLSDSWTVGYTLSFGLGQGSQQQNLSSSISTQNLAFSGMTQRDIRHELTLVRQINSRLALAAGIQFDAAEQTWDATSGRLDQENVAPGNRLTLVSGSSRDAGQELKQSARYQSVNLMFGVRLQLNKANR